MLQAVCCSTPKDRSNSWLPGKNLEDEIFFPKTCDYNSRKRLPKPPLDRMSECLEKKKETPNLSKTTQITIRNGFAGLKRILQIRHKLMMRNRR